MHKYTKKKVLFQLKFLAPKTGVFTDVFSKNPIQINRKVPFFIEGKGVVICFYKNRKVWKCKHITPPIETAYLKKVDQKIFLNS